MSHKAPSCCPLGKLVGQVSDHDPLLILLPLHLLGILSHRKCFDDATNISIHHPIQIVKCEVDSVVGQSVLREVVGSDFI